MNKAIQVAQEIVNSITDIRPEYTGKRVVSLSVSPPTEALTVWIQFEDGTSTSFVGTWAHEITRRFD